MVSQFDFPDLFNSTGQASAEAQNRFLLATGGALTCLAAGALTTLQPEGTYANIGPALTVLLFLVAFALQASELSNKEEHKWYAARAAAESIKTASREFAVAGESFRRDDQDAESRYREVLKSILKNVEFLDIGASGTSKSTVTDTMRELRAADLAVRAEAYLTLRVNEQIRWYKSKSKHNRTQYKIFGAVVAINELAAVILGLVRINSAIGPDSLGPTAAIAAGFIGWMQAKNANLSEAYAATSHEVSMVPSTLSADASEEKWAQAVHDAEAAFSREHTMWQARRQGPV
jgi:hypothetical protein